MAVLMAGRDGGAHGAHAYWFDSGLPRFTTSDHYRDALPEWVRSLNGDVTQHLPDDGCWRAEAPADVAGLSRRDTVEYEAEGPHSYFPHCEASERYRDAGHFISRTPFLDVATLALARRAVDALDLGRGDAPDYLALGLSATDRVGHAFGPSSREQLENLLRLDRELGAFLEFLDESVGRDGYLLALSSDHGVLPLPEYLEERGEPGMRVNAELPGELDRAVIEVLGAEAEGVAGSDPGEALGPDGRARLAELLEEVEWIEQAMPLELLASDAPADSFVQLYRNSFHPERLGSRLATYGVDVRLAEGALNRGSGTTHGVPYLHDRAVPLVFYGRGIEPGTSGEAVRTVDLAATLARLLELPAPQDLDGRPLLAPGGS